MPEPCNPLQAAADHIDPVIFAEALTELDWTPQAELKELIDIAKNNDNIRHKLGAMQILRSRIIENLELSGAIQLIQERIRGQLPGGQYTAERSRYLSSDAASSTHAHLKTLNTERLDVSAPSTPENTENTNDDDPAGDSRSSAGVRQDDLEDECPNEGPGPTQPDERPRAADPGSPPEQAPRGSDAAGTGHQDTDNLPAPTASAEVPRVPKESEAETPGAEEPFRLRKPAARPAFGRPLGRRTPTKPTIGGGICGPPEAEALSSDSGRGPTKSL